MARYSCGFTPSGVGTTLRPCAAILSTATVTPLIREVAVFNTTATACNFELVRFSGGTAGPDQTEFKWRENAPTASCVAKGLWTADASIGDRTGYIFELGAAIGDGTIEVFGGEALEALAGATAGVGLLLIAGAPATAPRVRFVWDE
jgi:hypothetical protein